MKRIIALCLLIALCSSSLAAKPRKPRKKACDCTKSEARQKKVATVFLVSIGIVTMLAIQDGNENRQRK